VKAAEDYKKLLEADERWCKQAFAKQGVLSKKSEFKGRWVTACRAQAVGRIAIMRAAAAAAFSKPFFFGRSTLAHLGLWRRPNADSNRGASSSKKTSWFTSHRSWLRRSLAQCTAE
jgi:hypothetical protein